MAGEVLSDAASPQTTKSGRWSATAAVNSSPAASRAAASAMSPACTSATRTVGPPTGTEPSR